MSTKSFANVERSFPAEVEEAFGFLTAEFGLGGPQRGGIVIPVVTYAAPGTQYRIMLDTDDRAVITSIHVEVGGTHWSADLDQLASAAGLASPNQVPNSAHTLHSLHKALHGQAALVRRLHPRLTTPEAAALMRRANARTWSDG